MPSSSTTTIPPSYILLSPFNQIGGLDLVMLSGFPLLPVSGFLLSSFVTTSFGGHNFKSTLESYYLLI